MAVKAVIDAPRQRLTESDHLAARPPRHKINPVVVVMVVGDQDQVGGPVIAVPRKGVDINVGPVRRRDAKTAVSLIIELCHNCAPF